MPTRAPSPRRRGGQPGNINAMKHGLFARKDHPIPTVARAPIPVLLKKEPVVVLLTYAEETELLRVLFSVMARLYPDASRFIDVFPVFRKVTEIIFLEASTIRAQRPLSAEDYAGLAANLDQLMRLITNA